MATLGTDGANLIKASEGFSLEFYGYPYGYPTVGWGHLITNDVLSNSLNLGYTSPISQSKANTFFAEDTPTGSQFSQSQFDALVSLTFNAGPGGLTTSDVQAILAYKQIYPTFIGPLSQNEIDTYSKLVSKAFSYDRNLQKRRNEEAQIIFTGIFRIAFI